MTQLFACAERQVPRVHHSFALLVASTFLICTSLSAASADGAAPSQAPADAENAAAAAPKDKQTLGSATSSTISVRELGIPEGARMAFEKGRRLLVDEHKAEDSLAPLHKAARIAPGYWEAFLLLGVAYMDMRKWSDAEPPLRRAIATNGRLGAAYLALGSCLLEEGKYPEAEQRLLQGLDLDPDAAHGHYDLSRTYYVLGRFDDARVQAFKAVDVGPASADVHFLLGNILLRLGKRQEALAQFQECSRLSSEAPLEALARGAIKSLQSHQTPPE